jgi:TP901 family phage tail tape measure protein
MTKTLEIAIILSAVDKATRVLNEAFNKQNEKLKALQEKSSKLLAGGTSMMAAGVALGASLSPAVSAFAELEDSSIRLRNAMTDNLNKISPFFEGVNKLAINLGSQLPGNTTDFQNMFEVLLNNGVPAKSILDGVGKSAAYLAVALKMPYDEAAQFAAKLRIATGIADEDMMKFMDTLQRTSGLGIAVGEMQYAFGRSAGALKLMGLQGLEAAKSVSLLYAMILRGGLSGETTGTGFANIINSLLNPDKLQKMNDAASELGVSLSFFDNAGNFKGIENFIAQLDQLKGFTPEQRAGIVNSLTGGGQDAQMLQTIISNGIEGYKNIREEQEKKMSLDAKVEAQLKSLSNIWEATTGNITNLLAAFGSTLAPVLKGIASFIGLLANAAQWLVTNMPTLSMFIGLVIGLSSAVLIVAGVIKIASGAMALFNATVLANPMIWLAIGIAVVVAGMITLIARWHELVKWFKEAHPLIKMLLAPLFLILWPFLLIAWAIRKVIDNWDDITAFFNMILNYAQSLPDKLYEAGANIVDSIKRGIKSKWEEFKSWWGQKIQGIRDFLPFSPAKVGPLKDLHKLKIMETIAASVKAEPLSRAMARSTGVAMASVPRALSSVSNNRSASFGGTTVHYSPVVTISGGSPADKAAFGDMLRQHKDELMRLIDEANNRRNRLKFA